MNRPEPSIYDITYEWPVNLFRYEGRIFGLNIIEIGALIAGFFIPVTLLGWQGPGVVVSVVLMVLTFLSLRRIERLGNHTLPVYLWKRLQYQRTPRTLVLPLVMGSDVTQITIYDPETDTSITVQ